MSRLTTTAVRPDHVRRVAAGMARADRDEVMAAAGHTPLRALRRGVRISALTRTVLVDDEPVAIWGVTEGPDPTIGSPWMLTTGGLYRARVAAARASAEQIDTLLERYRLLTNWIDERNELHLRWLEWLGAEFVERCPRGPAGLPFLRFEIA